MFQIIPAYPGLFLVIQDKWEPMFHMTHKSYELS